MIEPTPPAAPSTSRTVPGPTARGVEHPGPGLDVAGGAARCLPAPRARHRRPAVQHHELGRGPAELPQRCHPEHPVADGFSAAFLTTYVDEIDLGVLRGAAPADVARVVRRAQAVGALREDFAIGDVGLILRAAGGLDTGSPDRDRRATGRLVSYLLDGARAERRDAVRE